MHRTKRHSISAQLENEHGAFLLDQDENSQDNFIINVGASPAGTECHISISYVSELDLIQDGRKIRFVVPTTIAPRYNPDPDKRGITAPANTNAKYVQTSPYTIEFRCEVEKRGVKGVSSISHPIQLDFSREDAFLVILAQEKIQLDRDILLDIDLAENRSNTIITVEAGAVMISFTSTEEECRRPMNKVDTNNEFIFVIDCSRSLVKGLARATNGRFVLIPPGSQVDFYVGEQLQKALQMSLADLRIKWSLGTPATSIPEEIPPVYANDRLILYALANDSTSIFDPSQGHKTSKKFHVFTPKPSKTWHFL